HPQALVPEGLDHDRTVARCASRNTGELSSTAAARHFSTEPQRERGNEDFHACLQTYRWHDTVRLGGAPDTRRLRRKRRSDPEPPEHAESPEHVPPVAGVIRAPARRGGEEGEQCGR